MNDHANDPDGGPAFPVQAGPMNNTEFGMTLRDYFAAQALAGLLANPNLDLTPQATAGIALQHADAMLAEREKRGGR